MLFPYIEILPPGWEKKDGKDGRPFYVNHNKRKVQWDKPTNQVEGKTLCNMFWQLNKE